MSEPRVSDERLAELERIHGDELARYPSSMREEEYRITLELVAARQRIKELESEIDFLRSVRPEFVRAEERERCAKIAADWWLKGVSPGTRQSTCNAIAAAIREGEPKP